MAGDLKNKVVVITGGAEGIGFAIADKFLQQNAKVVLLVDIAEEQGLKSATVLCNKYGENRAVFMKCDVTKDLHTVLNKIINTYKYIDVLVNSAGICNDQLCKKTISINVQSLIDWSLKFWEHMRTDKGGKGGTIINLASIYGFRVDPYLPIYQASKFAVIGFTKSLGHTYNFNRAGVRVLGICPGLTETKLSMNVKNFDESTTKAFAEHVGKMLRQKADAVGNAAVEAFKNAKSGTAWLIEGAQPIVEV